METIHANGTPLADYLLEGDGCFDQNRREDDEDKAQFAPPNIIRRPAKWKLLPPLQLRQHQSHLSRLRGAWSSANLRLGRVENERFMEHFRYIIVASQLLDEYVDHPRQFITPTNPNSETAASAVFQGGFYSIAAVASSAAVVTLVSYLLSNWPRCVSGSGCQATLVTFSALVFVSFASYVYFRLQWLKSLRQRAVNSASALTNNWQSLEVSTAAALSLIQEVELVSKGYRISTPMPPVSRLENQGGPRRCARLRKAVYRAQATVIPACAQTCHILSTLVDEDDVEKYFDVYNVQAQDVKEASGGEIEEAESLQSLRVLSYRAALLRRATLCFLMALGADGGRSDLNRWRVSTEVMEDLGKTVGAGAERLARVLAEMDSIPSPRTPVKNSTVPGREQMRQQVRKIDNLSSGIRSLQAKMQLLRDEANRCIKQSDADDLGPSLMDQYDAIGTDLKDLMQAWEAGKSSLQTQKQVEDRSSVALTGSPLHSPISSISGVTAVEDGKADELSDRFSGDSASDEEQVFEAIALPRTCTREERQKKMHEERERQMSLRAQRDRNTSMLRELESVINLRPKERVM